MNEPRDDLEAHWSVWLATLFPYVATNRMTDHQAALWEWVWLMREKMRPEPRIELWARGHAKTSTGELATLNVGARGVRTYGLYVTRTQELANQKVGGNISALLESPLFAMFYPEHADRKLSKFGHSRGWKVNRLRTRGGFTLDAIGLDAAQRGLKTDEQRPDWIWVDDVDDPADSQLQIRKHLTRLTRNVLPARSQDAAVLFTQNLVRTDGVFGQLLNRKVDMLADATVTGPIPAIEGLEVEQRDGRFIITAGTPTWPEGFPLDACQDEINTSGLSSFMAEHQHEPQDVVGVTFASVEFEDFEIDRSEVPALDRIVTWCDPAVEGDAGSSQGVCAGGIDREGIIYLMSGYEGRSGPDEAMRTAIRFAIAEGSPSVGLETTQGGKLWDTEFKQAVLALGESAKGLRLDKVKPSRGKEERMTDVLLAFQRNRIRIVRGTHLVIEAALRRFPAEPNDLADAVVHCVADLAQGGITVRVPPRDRVITAGAPGTIRR